MTVHWERQKDWSLDNIPLPFTDEAEYPPRRTIWVMPGRDHFHSPQLNSNLEIVGVPSVPKAAALTTCIYAQRAPLRYLPCEDTRALWIQSLSSHPFPCHGIWGDVQGALKLSRRKGGFWEDLLGSSRGSMMRLAVPHLSLRHGLSW